LKGLEETVKIHAESLYIYEAKSIPEISKITGISLTAIYTLKKDRDWKTKRENVLTTDINGALCKYQRSLCMLSEKIEAAVSEERIDVDELSRLSLIAKNFATITASLLDQTTALTKMQALEGIQLFIAWIEKTLPAESVSLCLQKAQEFYAITYEEFTKA
jgi:hypothetical protein